MSRIQASDDPSDTRGREPRVGKKCRHRPQIFWPSLMLRHCTPLSDALLHSLRTCAGLLGDGYPEGFRSVVVIDSALYP